MILAGDIGGTHTRLVLVDAGRSVLERVFTNADHPDLETVVASLLGEAGHPRVEAVALAAAGPVLDGRVRMTNLAWTLEESTLSRTFGGAPVRLLNDLEAAAYGVFTLSEGDVTTIAMGDAVPRGNVAVIAAGTGLGEALVTWYGDTPIAIASEGGHADYAPRDTTEVALLEWLARSHGHVSWERVVSGPGIVAVYEFLRETGREQEPAALRERLRADAAPASVITSAAIAEEHVICARALEIFVRAYGAEAGNLALKGMSRGGVYVAGGIAPHVLQGRWRDAFMDAFVAKGRYAEFMRRIPVRVVTSEKASLVGASAVAERMAHATR